MLEAQNERRRRSGRPELTEEDMEARVREDEQWRAEQLERGPPARPDLRLGPRPDRGLRLSRAIPGGGADRARATRSGGRPGSLSGPPQIEAAGAEAAVADPDRLGTILPLLEGVSVVCWLMGSAPARPTRWPRCTGRGCARCRRSWWTRGRAGLVYEAAGSVDSERAGRGRGDRPRGGGDLPDARGGGRPRTPPTSMPGAAAMLRGRGRGAGGLERRRRRCRSPRPRSSPRRADREGEGEVPGEGDDQRRHRARVGERPAGRPRPAAGALRGMRAGAAGACVAAGAGGRTAGAGGCGAAGGAGGRASGGGTGASGGRWAGSGSGLCARLAGGGSAGASAGGSSAGSSGASSSSSGALPGGRARTVGTTSRTAAAGLAGAGIPSISASIAWVSRSSCSTQRGQLRRWASAARRAGEASSPSSRSLIIRSARSHQPLPASACRERRSCLARRGPARRPSARRPGPARARPGRAPPGSARPVPGRPTASASRSGSRAPT